MDVGLVGVRPDAARRELARRELARRRLMPFMQYVSPWYRPARVHDLIASKLEQVELFIRTRGEQGIGRLLIETHPRVGKSELVSKHFPAWVLGKNPDKRVILTSYGADLAVANSRAAREILLRDAFRAVFGGLATVDAPVELSSDSRSVQAWDLASPHRGGLVAAGVGGGITGKGAHLMVVDDPFKNREEAESEDRRRMVWDWWTSSAYTRLEDGAAVIGMFTRWHGDDWAGRLLKQMATDAMADRYEVVCLPAIWEEPTWEGEWEEFFRKNLLQGVWVDREDALGRLPGEALWPDKYNRQALDKIRANIGIYDFEALYQQRPYLRSGGLFQRDWFPIVEQGPKPDEIAERIRFWDKAGSRKRLGDFAVGVLMCRTFSGVYYVEHVARGQWRSHERDQAMLETAKFDARREGPETIIWHQQEPASAGVDSAEHTNQMFAQAGFTAHFETLSGDKVVRAGPWSSMCEGGGARLVRGGWNEDFIEEHAAFPNGVHDDQVDAASTAFNKLAQGGPVVLFGA